MKDCIIVGSGPAGYTAAIYAARAGLNPLMITGRKIGGQLMDTTDVDNFPGYPDGVKGSDMMRDLAKQAARMGVEFLYCDVLSIERSSEHEPSYFIHCEDKVSYETRTVIIATGASAKYLGLESEQRYAGMGVSACATCDGFFFKGEDVAVIGGGDTACEEALYLSKLCKSVSVIVRGEKLRASVAMQERVKSNEKIRVYYGHQVTEIVGEKNVSSIRMSAPGGVEAFLPVTGVFVAIGHTPNTAFLGDFLRLDETGYIYTHPGCTLTNRPGVFACGDVQDNVYRQAVTAAGTGCMAALDAERYLNELK